MAGFGDSVVPARPARGEWVLVDVGGGRRLLGRIIGDDPRYAGNLRADVVLHEVVGFRDVEVPMRSPLTQEMSMSAVNVMASLFPFHTPLAEDYSVTIPYDLWCRCWRMDVPDEAVETLRKQIAAVAKRTGKSTVAS